MIIYNIINTTLYILSTRNPLHMSNCHVLLHNMFLFPAGLSHLSSIGTTIQTCAQPPQRQKDPTPAQEVQHLSQQLS